MKISLCMIVRDEEEVLGRCLESARLLADETVVLDTGSRDKTKEIARRFTSAVYDFPWQDDFALARNASFDLASGDYLMWLDADDVILPADAQKFPALRALLSQEPEAVMCPYQTGGLRFLRERVVKNNPQNRWRGRVHECIPPHGKVLSCDFTVTHLRSEKPRGSRNLEIYRKWAAEEPLSGRDLFYYGRELRDHGLYEEAEGVLEDMLAGEGWYVNKIEACKVLASCRTARGLHAEALSALFQSFCYGEPRASVLCAIGELLKSQKRFREAATWYEWAILCRDHTAEGDFELPSCRGIVPVLELVWLYHALGEEEKSLAFHKKSEAIAPDHPSVVYNRNYFGC